MAIPFPALQSNVHILGQPEVLGCMFIAHIRCACSAKTPMMIPLGGVVACGECQQPWGCEVGPTGQPQIVRVNTHAVGGPN